MEVIAMAADDAMT